MVTPRTLSRAARRWLVGFGALVVVTAVVAALGGFEPAARAAARILPGQQVDLGRWLASVDRCEVVPPAAGSTKPPVATLYWTLENTSGESLMSPDRTIYAVKLPNGQRVDGTMTGTPFIEAPGAGWVDPHIPVEATWQLPVEGPLWGPDGQVEVTLGYEVPSTGTVAVGAWELSHVIGSVHLPCPEARP